MRLKAGIVAPLILGPEGQIEDSVRRMITPLRIVKWVCGLAKVLDYEIGTAPIARRLGRGHVPCFRRLPRSAALTSAITCTAKMPTSARN